MKIKIEGVGEWLSSGDLSTTDGDGQTEFWSAFPSYVDGTITTERDLLADLPSLMSERNDPLGGFPELGEINFSLVDVNDYLTEQLRFDRPPATVLSEDVTSSESSIDVDSVSSISDTSVIYVGSEAMRVSNVAGTTLTVDRGYLGTTAQTHDADARVYLSIPYLRNRLAEMWIVPLDGTRADEVLVGQYAIDQLSFDPVFNTWSFSARSLLKHLHRQAPIRQRSFRVVSTIGNGSATAFEGFSIDVEPVGVGSVRDLAHWTGSEGDDFIRCFLQNEKEIIGCKSSLRNGLTIGRRAILGTKVEEIKTGSILRECFVAEINGACSFRYSPGATPSTSRSSGTWIKTAHWIDLCLIIMTSSADPSDGLELTNYIGSEGNYSVLPPGYGLGLPASLIDWDSWKAVKQRTADYVFPNFIYGGNEEPTSFGDLIETHFLKPIGGYLSVVGGTARIILPRVPLAGDATITIGPADILTQEVGKRLYEPRISVRQNLAQHTGRIIYLVGPEKEPINFSSGDFAGTFGQRGYYSNDDKPITIEVPSGKSFHAETRSFLGRCASRRLFRWHRPNTEIDVDVDVSKWALNPGDLFSLTLHQMPGFSAATRGVENLNVEVLEREPVLDKRDGAFIKLLGLGYGPNVRAGRIAPSAAILSVDSNTVTVATNRYTKADAAGELPTTDAASFAIGDFVELVNPDGSSAAAGFQEVTAIDVGAQEIDLDGDFSGALNANLILVFSNADDATFEQTSTRVSYADLTNQNVGTTTDAAWLFAEP